MAERLSALEKFVKAQADAVSIQQVYLQGLHSSKPEEAQTLAACFGYVEQELGLIKAAMKDPVHKQKMLDEAKRMVQSAAQEIKDECSKALVDALSQATVTAVQMQDKFEDRIKTVEAEITQVKIMTASGGSIAPMRTPPGHLPSSSSREVGARRGSLGLRDVRVVALRNRHLRLVVICQGRRVSDTQPQNPSPRHPFSRFR